MRLIIRRPGLGASLQDRGRRGYLRYGVSWSGAMDWFSSALALKLAGAAADAPFLEIGGGGIELAVADGTVRLGWVAPGFKCLINNEPLAAPASVVAKAGDHLAITPGHSGLWSYLAFGGRLRNVTPLLGSYASHQRSHLSCCRLDKIGQLEIAAGTLDGEEFSGASDLLPPAPDALEITRGPQWHRFSENARAALLQAGSWRLARRMDRMAYWLDGPRLEMPQGHDLPSEGAPLGSVEVVGSGQPLVLLADGQPTAGYPKIAVLSRAALPHFVQMRAGAALCFREVSREEATRSYLAMRQRLQSAPL